MEGECQRFSRMQMLCASRTRLPVAVAMYGYGESGRELQRAEIGEYQLAPFDLWLQLHTR